MIDAARWKALAGEHPALAAADPKLAGLARDELDPDEALLAAEAAKAGDAPGLVLISKRRVLALWQTAMLVFFKLPTTQEFNLLQVREVQREGARLRLRAVADVDRPDAGYEDNTFTFASEDAAARFEQLVQAHRGTLAD